MTIDHMIALLTVEDVCLQRNVNGHCSRECGSCELAQDDAELHEMYQQVAKTLEKLKKPRESRAKLPCPKCGRKRLSVWLSCDNDRKPIEAIACDKCKIASAWSHTTIGAIRDWNKVVREWTE